MTREDVEEKLQFILSNVDTICYICLVYRHKLNSDSSLYFNFIITKYLYDVSKVLINNNRCDLKSIQITLPTRNPIPSLCGIILAKLILSQNDTFGGMSVDCEQPTGNSIILNINKPGALRQYYGRNICWKSK